MTSTLSLLELDEEASGIDFEVPDLPDIEETFEVPHIKFSSKDLALFLKAARPIIATSDRSPISRSISIQVKNGVVYFRAIDVDVFLEFRTPLLNQKNILEEHLVISYPSLVKFLKAASPKLVFLKKEKDYFIRLLGGDVIVDSYEIPVEKMASPRLTENEGTVSGEKLLEIIRKIFPLAQSATIPSEKRLLFTGKTAIAVSNFTVSKGEIVSPAFEIRARDASVLSSLLNGDLAFRRTKKDEKFQKIQIEGDNFTYTIPNVSAPAPKVLLDSIPQVFLPEQKFQIETSHFSKLVDIAADLPYATGRILVNVVPDAGNIVICIPTNKGKFSEHNIPSQQVGTPVALTSSLNLQAKQLQVALKAYSGIQMIDFFIAEKGVGISATGYQTAVFSST